MLNTYYSVGALDSLGWNCPFQIKWGVWYAPIISIIKFQNYTISTTILLISTVTSSRSYFYPIMPLKDAMNVRSNLKIGVKKDS